MDIAMFVIQQALIHRHSTANSEQLSSVIGTQKWPQLGERWKWLCPCGKVMFVVTGEIVDFIFQ